MRKNYVEICGVDTSKLTVMKEEKKRDVCDHEEDERHQPLSRLISQ